jgi:exopolyphosphatase/guanosine-5'-triphosphate,3'-diphosphate pyrophosphatase
MSTGLISLSCMLIYNIPGMPLLSSIDVGSNTLRLLIAKFVGNRIIDVYSDRKITRLGSMIDRTRILRPENIALSLQALREFSSVINRHGVRHVKTVATSALREAVNADTFIKRVWEETDIRIEVISGEKEAQLILKGILHAFSPAGVRAVHPLLPTLPREGAKEAPPHTLFIMDIGGGSTEWIAYQGEDRYVMGSLPAGVIKLARECIRTDPLSETDIKQLTHEIHRILEPLETELRHLITRSTLFIGTAGTFTTIASVDLGLASYSREKIHLHRIPFPRLMKMQKEFLRLSLEERRKIQGLEPERADLIIPGLQFTMNVMELFRFRELIISDYGLLEGALLAMKETSEEGLPETGKS